MSKKPENNGNSGAIVLGIAGAVAALAAGAYFIGTKDGKKQVKKINGWMLKVKGDVLEKMEAIRNIDEEKYHKILETVSEKYGKLKQVNKAELDVLIKDLKSHWIKIKKDINGSKKKSSKSAKSSKKSK